MGGGNEVAGGVPLLGRGVALLRPVFIHKILTAAIQEPYAKNRQPWRFVVVQGEKRAEMLRIMRDGIALAIARGEARASQSASLHCLYTASSPVVSSRFHYDPAARFHWWEGESGIRDETKL